MSRLSDDTTIQANGIRKSSASPHMTIVMMIHRVRSDRFRTAREVCFARFSIRSGEDVIVAMESS